MEIYGFLIYWLGHASFLIQFPIIHKERKEIIIYIDPYDLKKEKNLAKADLILVTHTHYDHFSLEDIKKVLKNDTVVIGPKEINDFSQNIIKLLPSESKKVKIQDTTIDITTVPAYNNSKQFHPKKNGWLGYIIEMNGKKIYHTGDSDFVEEMKKIKTDILLVPIGGTYTMNPQEAAELVNTIKPEYVIPMHWGKIVGKKEDAINFKSLINKNIKVLILDNF